MNERLYAVCADIPDAGRRRDRGAFFKSIHGTLNHLLLGDRLWLGRFVDRPFQVDSLDQELYADFDALRVARAQTDGEILDFSATLDEEALARDFSFTTIVNPGEHVFPLRHVSDNSGHPEKKRRTSPMRAAGTLVGVQNFVDMRIRFKTGGLFVEHLTAGSRGPQV